MNNPSQKTHTVIFWNKITETSSTCSPQTHGNTTNSLKYQKTKRNNLIKQRFGQSNVLNTTIIHVEFILWVNVRSATVANCHRNQSEMFRHARTLQLSKRYWEKNSPRQPERTSFIIMQIFDIMEVTGQARIKVNTDVYLHDNLIPLNLICLI